MEAPVLTYENGHARERSQLLPVGQLEVLRLEEKSVFPEKRAIVHVRLL